MIQGEPPPQIWIYIVIQRVKAVVKSGLKGKPRWLGIIPEKKTFFPPVICSHCLIFEPILSHLTSTVWMLITKLTRLFPLCCVFSVQVSSVCVRVPAARRSTEVSTDLSVRGKTHRWCVCVYVLVSAAHVVDSEGWSDLHTMCPVSVATNWIRLAVLSRQAGSWRWAFQRKCCIQWDWNQRESYNDRLGADVFDWHHSLIRSAALSLSISFLSFLSLPVIYLSAALAEKRACPYFNSAEVKRWRGKNEVSWFWCFTVNDGKLQCRRQWLEACCTAARGRGEQREGGMEKVTSSVGTNSHHFDLVCVHVHTHTSQPLTLSCMLFHSSSSVVGDEDDRWSCIQV